MTKWSDNRQLADELAVFLALVAMAEPMGYPKLAKVYHQQLATFDFTNSRMVTFGIDEKLGALDALPMKIIQGT